MYKTTKADSSPQPQHSQSQGVATITDSRPSAGIQLKLESLMANSPQTTSQLAGQAAMKNSPVTQQKIIQQQEKPNNTGLPNQLKAGIESLSGMSMDHVRVHYNSDKPAQLNAHAYAQGSDIHMAPGQEKHLPHEAWHVVQQAQGRVRPTMQMKGNVPLNDDAGLEAEADAMGEKAMQTGSLQFAERKTSLKGTGSAVIQGKLKKLKIGIISATQTVSPYANELPSGTYAWILSNKAVAAGALAGVTAGHNRSSYNEIINANQANVANRIRADEARSGGEVVSRIFQSGAFEIPRQNAPNNRNEVDYSFLRFAAFESYKLWHAAVGNGLGWPSLTDSKTQTESIDSDVGGLTTKTDDVETDDNGNIKTDWLAEAGVYSWDWTEVIGNDAIRLAFTAMGAVDTAKRDKALKKFSDEYDKAEIAARTTAKNADIFRIYFPEPATRISPSGLTLLDQSGFGDLSVTAGQQLGHKRESIGLIASLVYLNQQNGDNLPRSKAKLRFNTSYKVKTGLGARKADYASVFLEWYRAADDGHDGFNDVDISALDSARAFDQSYLNPDIPGNVQTWHNNTLERMTSTETAGRHLLKPRST